MFGVMWAVTINCKSTLPDLTVFEVYISKIKGTLLAEPCDKYI